MILKNCNCITQKLIRLTYKRQMSVVAKALRFQEFGEPLDVLQLVEQNVERPKGKQVLIKVLAAPINPSDVYTIQGQYPVKIKFPAVAGNECVAEVISVGEQVEALKSGDRVAPLRMGLGTWTTHALYDERQLFPVSNKINLVDAATIAINPTTAYCMLKKFVKLSPGDTVIQNGANSAVGQIVHQLCKNWNINSVGVVRNRPAIALLKQKLKALGASEVFTDDEIRSATVFKEGKLKRPCLAFNCVGGRSANEIARQLNDNGVLVTYGGMSAEPITIPTAQLIFRNITFCGFHISQWIIENSTTGAHRAMIDELCYLFENGHLLSPTHKLIDLENYKDAAEALSFKGFTGKKFILKMFN